MLASEGNLEPDFLRMKGQSENEGKSAKFTHCLKERNPFMLPRATSRREISQAHQRSPKNTAGDFLY